MIFLINLSEHVKRPKDMLMFLGEYFKKCVEESQIVDAANSGNENKSGKKM